VAEYIQPFNSYTEMYKYADEIREILQSLSSVYLIGDVGITPNNYANWGQRVGSEEPVCLDFAYVYDVGSDLLLCHSCKNNSMLVPNKDFTELYCSSCGKKYKFEDIRGRIGNDMHRHEIGDLSDEGYEMTESNVLRTLDPNKSNYLVTKKKVVEKPKEEVINIGPDTFTMNGINENLYINNKEDNNMAKDVRATIAQRMVQERMNNQRAINVKVWMADQQEPAVKESDDGLAFAGTMGDDVIQATVVEATVVEAEVVQVPQEEEHVIYDGKSEEHIPAENHFDMSIEDLAEDSGDEDEFVENPVTTETVAPSVQVEENEEEPVEVEEEFIEATVVTAELEAEEPVEEEIVFPDNFIDKFHYATSKLSNKMSEYLHQTEMFDDVKSYCKDKKLLPEKFYRACQNAIFRSLVAFVDCDTVEVPNNNPKKPGTHTEWILKKDDIYTADYFPTLVFIERFWNNRNLNQTDDCKSIMEKYDQMFPDYRGIQREWLPTFVDRLCLKFSISKSGAEIVARGLETWCLPEEEYISTELRESLQEESLQEEIQQNPVENADEASIHAMLAEAGKVNNNATIIDESVMKQAIEDDQMAFSAEMITNAVNEFDEEVESEEDDEDTMPAQSLTVEIYPDDDGMDIVKIISSESSGDINIPLYVNIAEIDPSKKLPSLADDRNGKWDWLIHFTPDIMFRTKNPEYWLNAANDDEIEEEQIHMVILDMNEETGEAIIGVYYLMGIFVIDNDGDYELVDDEETLNRINTVICDEIGNGAISHLRRTLSMPDLVHDEDYVKDFVQVMESDDEDGEEEMGEEFVTSSDEQMNAAEQAAIEALLGTPGRPAVVVPNVSNDSNKVETAESVQVEEDNQNMNISPAAQRMIDEAEADGHRTFAPIRRKGNREN